MEHLVLVADNDNATRVGLAALLTEAGYAAIAVSSLGTALQAIADERPDLLVVGLELAGSSGLQLLATNPRPVPALLLSGFRDAMLEREARHLGAEWVVTPLAPDTLLEKIHQKLATSDEAFEPARRWQRKRVDQPWRLRVEDSPARVLDVSYGGMRMEVDRAPGAWLPLSFSLEVPPAPLPMEFDVVWKRRKGESTWLCGAAVSDENQATWRHVVDSLG